MKLKIILTIFILVTIITIIYLILNKPNNKKVEISEIKRFTFSYTTGYMVNAYVRYEIEYKANKYIARIKPNGKKEEELLETELDLETIKNIEKILKDNNVSKWNGFNKVDKDVLDGNSFSISITMSNDEQITASGYMKYPDNYGNVRGSLDNIFDSIYKGMK